MASTTPLRHRVPSDHVLPSSFPLNLPQCPSLPQTPLPKTFITLSCKICPLTSVSSEPNYFSCQTCNSLAFSSPDSSSDTCTYTARYEPRLICWCCGHKNWLDEYTRPEEYMWDDEEDEEEEMEEEEREKWGTECENCGYGLRGGDCWLEWGKVDLVGGREEEDEQVFVEGDGVRDFVFRKGEEEEENKRKRGVRRCVEVEGPAIGGKVEKAV